MNGISQSFDCDNVTVGGGHFQSDSSDYSPSTSNDYSSNIVVGGGHNQYDPWGYIGNGDLGNRTESVYNRSVPQSGTTILGINGSSILARIMTVGNDSESRAWTNRSESQSLYHSWEATKEMALAFGYGLANDHQSMLEHGINAFVEQGKSIVSLWNETVDLFSGLKIGEGTIPTSPDLVK
jgi:hypothetical protein